MARRVYVRHSELISESQEKQLSPEKQLTFIKTKIKSYIDELLTESGKKNIEPGVVRNRMRQYIRDGLDKEMLQSDPFPQMFYRAPSGEQTERPLADLLEKEAAQLVHEANTLEHADDWFYPTLYDLVTCGVLEPDEVTSENSMGLVRTFLRTKSTLLKIKAARIRGDFSYEQAFWGPEYAVTLENASEGSQAKVSQRKQKHLISAVIERFCEDRIGSKQWQSHMLAEHKMRLDNMVEILGDQPIEKIERKDFRTVRDTLLKLPPSRKKNSKYKNKTIAELVSMNHKKTLSVKTVNDIMIAISSMIQWCVNEGILEHNLAKDLQIKDTRSDIDKRDAFTIDDINKIFFDGSYTKYLYKNEAYYWCPLISLYTGMRLEEICQLNCSDIYKEEEIWIIDIRSEGNDSNVKKHIKTSSAIRKIPIHDKLIDLGLIRYLEEQKKKSEVRLFPKLNRSTGSEKYGKQVGKNFSMLVKSKGITGNKTFHSLRHTFADFYKQRNLQDDVFEYIFGHKLEKLAARQYGSRFSVSLCYKEIISKLDYSIDTTTQHKKQ